MINEPLEFEPGEERELTATNDYGDANHFQTSVGSETRNLDLAVTVADSAGNETARFNQEAFLVQEGRRGAGAKPKAARAKTMSATARATPGGTVTAKGARLRRPSKRRRTSWSATPRPGPRASRTWRSPRPQVTSKMVGKRGKQPGPRRPAHFLNKEYVEMEISSTPSVPRGWST
ncbi:MAG: hypothetical protein M3N18_11200 [Actinomycetota bacterium]|nr:hypothetical protein [Actinomycetota bacterium]